MIIIMQLSSEQLIPSRIWIWNDTWKLVRTTWRSVSAATTLLPRFYKTHRIRRRTIFPQIFYTEAQLAKAVACSYKDCDHAIVGDYKGKNLEKQLRCIYKNLEDVIIMPVEVTKRYITPREDLDELVFVSKSELARHLTLTATVDRLLHMTDIQHRITVSPSYIEFATQESPFLQLLIKKNQEDFNG